jgi:hypothetical protein
MQDFENNMLDQWFYERSGENIGPLSTVEIVSLCRSGQIDRSTLVWKKNTQDWKKISDLPEFVAHLQGPPPRDISNFSNNPFIVAVAFSPIIVVAIFTIITAGLDIDASDSRVSFFGFLSYLAIVAYGSYRDEVIISNSLGARITMRYLVALIFLPLFFILRGTYLKNHYPHATLARLHWPSAAWILCVAGLAYVSN